MLKGTPYSYLDLFDMEKIMDQKLTNKSQMFYNTDDKKLYYFNAETEETREVPDMSYVKELEEKLKDREEWVKKLKKMLHQVNSQTSKYIKTLHDEIDDLNKLLGDD